jgi:hypothetical protein
MKALRTVQNWGRQGWGRRLLATIAVASLVGGVGLMAGSSAQAEPDDPNPRTWAEGDYRIPSRDDVVLGMTKLAVKCQLPLSGQVIDGLLLSAANHPTLRPPEATVLSCLLGAPAAATCEQLTQCYGAGGAETDVPTCDGSLLRTAYLDQVTGTRQPVASSCRAVGGRCYNSPIGSFCGHGPCEAGQTYGCDGDAILACMHGVTVRTPCGRGMTCGRSAGSHVIDCIGSGPTCTASRCDGEVLRECIKDSFGGGREREVDCSELGLTCHDGGAASCVVPTATAECSASDEARCAEGRLKVCVAGKWAQVSCGELGLSGRCAVPDVGHLTCK